ncbi:MAG: hypothetical protein KAR51_04915, partial [Candidatus Aenigmarchaeota archaeon]|nr:hypothetical protein [Candidatus Aenigmarchaeota archaeon]
MNRLLITEITDTDTINLLKNTNLFDISAEDTISKENLLKNIGKYDAIMVRTYTIITRDIIDAAKDLK